MSERESGTAGGTTVTTIAARAGFLPIALAQAPAAVLSEIPLYLRSADADDTGPTQPGFTLYRAEGIPFTNEDRQRLLDHHVNFVYVRMSDQTRFREQVEARLHQATSDSRAAVSAKSALIYETAVALIDDLLNDPDRAGWPPRLERVSRSITTLVMDDPSAFSHLFAASHHDFYTATHMVNVATCMVPLAYTLGYREPDELNRICQAGLLHDIGKLYVPEEILNRPGTLSDEDWVLIRRHPEAACTHLEEYEGIDPLVLTVARQHHERLDGSGYPQGLRGDQIHRVSMICAVIDVFDAMTAVRPFKKGALTVAEAGSELERMTPDKLDAEVVRAWLSLLSTATEALPPASVDLDPGRLGDRRPNPRYAFSCPARVHILDCSADGWRERPALQVVTHSLSRSGVGLLTQVPIPPGTHVNVYLLARAWERDYVRAQSVRCRAYRDGWYDVGLAFADLDAESGAPEKPQKPPTGVRPA